MGLGISLGRSSSERGALGVGLRFLGCWCLGERNSVCAAFLECNI
jgi:hypothetical protein